ncbi:hypothetical protein WOLCODRAFT_139379 [Wolfiporia cocos MD-104 SS10]|uniref:Uncharacterized protein n=1 Tax=Wolfiporia cocos (strain MD-104) TaxID=742152 RepID=A0A2H3JSF6_WOLCO|nr:hypothetical protein WOLCODRAFT_139379 [Wolfiporia cocos MD-104 SS10]
MAEPINQSLSELSLHSATASEAEDWDRSLELNAGGLGARTPRNSVALPVSAPAEGTKLTEGEMSEEKPKRSLSELLKLHAEKGKDVTFTPEEASRIAEVLGRWINSGPSPYEGEDDFFARAQDDLALHKRGQSTTLSLDASGRPRGQSDSGVNPSS